MVLSPSVLSDLLDAFRAGDGVDLVRDAALVDTHDDWQAGDRRELSAGSMSKLDPECDTGAVAELNTGD